MLLTNYSGYTYEAGTDEAGRGCLAGPVVAAAVLFPPTFSHPEIKDSKKLKPEVRNLLAKVICENALAWSTVEIWNEEIDKINILQASLQAMKQAVRLLKYQPQFVIADGNRFGDFEIPSCAIIKGDAKYLSVAAASILAKTHRDELMRQLHQKYQYYNWDVNKGYPTAQHREKIAQFGVSEYHRLSFRLTGIKK